MTTIYTLTEPQGTQVAGQTVGAIISTAGGFGPTSNTDTKVVISDTFPLINGKGGETVFARKGGYYLRSAIYKNKFYEGLNGSVYPDPTKDEPYQQFFKNARESCLEPDRELWLGFSIYVPSSFENENSSTANLSTQRTRMFVLQPSDVDRSIALLSITKDSLSNTADNIWLLSYYDNATSVYEGSAKNISLGYVKDDVGKWVDFVVRVRWNPFTTTTNPATAGIAKAVNQTFEGNKGILEIWKSTGEVNTTTGNRQMTKVFSIVNQPVGNVPGYEETTGSTTIDVARFSWGPYKYSWKKVAGSTVTGPIWFGFDEIKYGYADQGITYDTVLARSETYQPPVFPPPVSSATYVIPAGNFGSNTRVFDGTNLSAGFGGTSWRTTTGVTRLPQAGDIIELEAGNHIQRQLYFRNIVGAASNPITVRGPQTGVVQAVIRRQNVETGNFVWRIVGCNYMTIDGYSASIGSFSTAPYNCGIKVMYAANAVAGLGTTNKDGPAHFIKWHDAPVVGATVSFCEIDGGWQYAAPSIDANGSGSGFAFEGIGMSIGASIAADGRWNDGIKLLNNYIHGTQGEGLYTGSNIFNGDIPHRNVETAFNRIEDCGGGAIHQKTFLEGDNRCHHNLLLRCGQNAPTPSRISITVQATTCEIYNNWIEETASTSTRLNDSSGGRPDSIQAYMLSSTLTPAKAGNFMGFYGPYSTLPISIYNNVIIRGGNATLMATTGNQSHGISVGSADSSKLSFTSYIYNNTILDNYGIGINVNYADGGFIKNNIVLGNKQGQISTGSGVSVTQSGNLTSGSPSSLFVNYSADDFKLAAAVPASGTIGVDISATDYVDTVRETGSPDAGAYEFIETTPPPVTTATYIIPANGASNTQRTYNAALASTGFNGTAWITRTGVTRAPQPGDVIEFAAGTHGRTNFQNFDGTSSNKYTFRGPNTGLAIFRKATPANNFVLEFTACYHFILDGESTTQTPGEDGKRRNIKLMYPVTWTTYESTIYLKFNGITGSSSTTKLTTSHNCTVRYIEIDGGFSNENTREQSLGIGIHPHDTRINAVDYPGLFQENMIFEHCYLRDLSGDCMYLGPNYYVNLTDTTKSRRRPPLRNIKARYNYVLNGGKTAIQIKNAWQGLNEIHDNIIINGVSAIKPEGLIDDSWGTAAISGLGSAVSIYNNYVYNSGTGGIANTNDGGEGVSPSDLQPGGYYVTQLNSRIYNNIIINTAQNTSRLAEGKNRGITSAFPAGRTPIDCQVFNNTVSNAVGRGISIYQGWIRNNIIIGSGSAATNINNSGDATNNYIQAAGNWFVTQDYVNPQNGNWRLINPQPAVGTAGIDISVTDIVGVTRDSTPQVGAYEFIETTPPPVTTATYIIPANGASNTRREYDAAQASTGFNGSAWITTSSIVRAPQPGDVIEFATGTHGRTRFSNFQGTSANKYLFKGPNTGLAIFRKSTPAQNFVLDFTTCKHFIVNGESTTQPAAVDGKRRNIKLMYPVTWNAQDGTSYLKFNGNDGSSTVTVSNNCTIRYVEIDGGWSDDNNFFQSNGTGILTNDNGSLATDHPGLYQENIIIEHCYIRNIPGEGMYIGPNYETDVNLRKTPLRNITIRYNRVENTGVEGIGGKCWFGGVNAIHDNYCINNCVSSYNNNGKNAIAGQACSTDIYNNFIFKSGQSGIGLGNNFGITPTSLQPGGYYVTEFNNDVYNNVIVKTGLNTTFFTNGSGIGGNSSAGESRHVVHAFNNTIANVTKDGIQVDTGFIRNNIVVFYRLLATDFVIATNPGDATNNYTVNTPGTYFVNQDLDNPENGDWRLISPRAAVGTVGIDISATDITGTQRDSNPELGAYESGGAPPGGSVVTTGLISYLDASNSNSYPLTGTTWIDLSSSRVNFTIYNGGIFNSNSFVLDGVNDYIATGTSVLNLNANTGNNRTVEIWFKLLSWPVNGSQSFPTKGMLLGGAYNSTGALSIEGSGTNQGKFAWDWDDSTTIYGNTTLQLNTWYQLVLLFRSPRYVTYYVNGALDKAEFQTDDTTVNDQLEWNIGRSSRSFPTVNAVSDSSGNVVTPAEGPFYNLNVNCEVAIARQYSRLLSTSEILQNYNADKGKFDITFPVPTAPTLTAQVDSVAPTTKINLTWTASTVTSGTIANYELYKQSGTTWTNIYTGANRSFSDVNLTADTTYNYRVRAVSSSNQFSAYSTASAKTAAQPPAPAFSTFIIPSGTSDWNASIAQPNTLGTSKIPAGGDVIIISAGTSTTSASSGTRGPLIIRNVNGTSTKTIEIKCPTDGNIDIRKPTVSVGGVPLTIANSRHFILNGFSQNITAQNAQNNCGIRLLYATNAKVGTPDSPEAFLKITNSTTAGPSENYTIKYIFIDGGYTSGFTNDGYGVTCSDNSATRTNFPGKFIENISFENLVILSTAKQGILVGHTLSSNGLPVRNCSIFNVKAENIGREGIHLRSAWEGENKIYNCNLISCGKNSALAAGERCGLTAEECQVSIYNNIIKEAGDHGMRAVVFNSVAPGTSPGTGYPAYNEFTAEIYNNLLLRNGVLNSGNKSGIRTNSNTGLIPIRLKIYNNTCVSNAGHGINTNIECINGFVSNNICVENNSNAAQILIANSNITQSNNLLTGTISSLFSNPLADDYNLASPQLAQGAFETDISLTDIEGTAREITAPDVGAYEYTGVSNLADYTILAGTSNTFSVRNESSGDIIFTGTSWVASVVQPGQIIELAPGVHGKRYIQRLQGSAQNRITIRSSSQGKATIRSAVTDSDGQIFHIRDSNYYNIDGSNTPGETYGIKIMYSSAATPGGPLWFLRMDNEQYGQDVLGYPCRDVTVNNLEIDGGYGTAGVTNGAGISWNIVDGYFLRTVFGETTVFPSNLIIENCYVHHTETEGMYLGANHGKGLVGRENIIVRNCIIENVGWEAINIKAHWQGNNRVYNNRIIDAGLNPINGRSEASGINFTSSSGSAYNNYINGTAENGILFFNVSGGPLQSAYPNGTECYIYNNVVYGAGKHNTHDPNIFDSNQPNPKGINVGSERGDTARMKPFIFNNTIVDAASAGINLQVSDSYTGGFVKNNIIARSNPPAPWNHFVADGLKTPYVALEDADTSNIVAVANNPTSVSFADAARYDFRLTAPIAATGTIGVDISATDITGTARETSSPDAGAYEYVGISTIYNPPFPRLGGRMRLDDNVSDAQFYEDTAIIAKFHVWLESTFRTHSWVGGTYNLSNYIPFVKSLDTPYPGYTLIAGPYTNPVQTGTDVRQFVEKAFAEKGVGGNRDWMLRYAGTPVYSAWNDPVTYTTSGRNVIEAGKSVGGSTDSNVSNKFRGNPNLATTPDSSRVQPFPNGMRWHQWYARWWAAPASERTANGGSPLGDWTASGYGFMEPGSGWDFVYSDEVTLGDNFSNPNNADWDDDGVNEARTDAEIRTMIKNYHVDYCQTWKTLFQYYGRPNMMFFANLASLSAAGQEWYKNTELVDLYNGGICERVSGYEHGGSYAPYGAPVTGQGFGFGDWSAAVSTGDTGTGFMGRYWRAMRYTKNPKLVMFESDTTQVKAQWDAAGGIHAGKSLYYWARYYLCACLLDDGYYYASNGGSDKASGTPEAAFGRIPWLDEYQGGSLNQKGWMGYPKLPTPPRTAYSNGVWVREFDNALVVINPYQNGTRTITLPSPGSGFKWQRLSGTQDPTTNNGADQPLSLTIAEHDGFILRRVASLDENRVFATNFGDGVYIDGTTSNWFGSGPDHAGDGTVFFRGGDVPGYEFPVILWGGFLDGYNYTAMQVISQTGTSTPYTRCDVNQTDHPHQDHGFYDTNIDLIALPLADRPPTGTASAMKQKFVSQYRAATQTQHQLIVKPGGNNMAEQSNGFLYQRFYRKWEQDCFTNLSVNENYAMMLCQTKTSQFNMTFTDADGILRGPGTSDWRIVASFNPRFANPTAQNSSKIFFRAQIADSSFDFAGNYSLWKQDVSVPIFPDTWHYIEFAYRFSPNSDGFVWMAIDGVTVFSRSGATLPTWTGSGSAPKQNRVFMVPAYQTNEAAPRPLTTWITDYEMFTDWPVDATTPHPT